MPEIQPQETQLQETQLQETQVQETQSPEKLEKRARNVLLFQLSRSMKTKWQLAQILEKREIPPEIAQPLLDRFEEVQLIDDSVFSSVSSTVLSSILILVLCSAFNKKSSLY